MRTTNRVTAFSLYMSTCRYVMGARTDDPQTWCDLHLYLPYLRQALGCCVCSKILKGPMGHKQSPCLHVVCQECVGGKMKLKPSCSWCKDWNQFVINEELGIVVRCYRKLCDYISSTCIVRNLLNDTANGSTNTLITIIREGSTSDYLSYLTDDQETSSNDASPPKLEASPQIPSSPPSLAPEVLPERTRHRSSTRRQQKFSPSSSTNSSSPYDLHHAITQTLAAEHDYTKQDTDDESPPNIEPIKQDPPDQCTNHAGLTPKNSKRRHHRFVGDTDKDPQNDCVSEKRTRTKKPLILGCRCGMATANPGKLTCCGQRCPCYSMFKGCTDECKCKGCRNSRKADDSKPLQCMDNKNDRPNHT